MRELAKSRGGKCLSTEYINANTKLEWMCKEGHRWKAIPDTVKQGSWCPYCARNIKGTIQEMQELARSRDGKCLSKEYVNANTKLLWECTEGHRWKATPGHIKAGQWCPYCARKKRKQKSSNQNK